VTDKRGEGERGEKMRERDEGKEGERTNRFHVRFLSDFDLNSVRKNIGDLSRERERAEEKRSEEREEMKKKIKERGGGRRKGGRGQSKIAGERGRA
jgi:hypothetical protein